MQASPLDTRDTISAAMLGIDLSQLKGGNPAEMPLTY